MNGELKFRIEHAHDPKLDYHRWSLLGEHEWRAQNGTRRGTGYLWLVGVCNNTSCPGRILVRELDIGDLLDSLTGELA